MRRTVVLAAFAALAVALVALVEPPRRRTGSELARGPRALRVVPARVRQVELVAGTRRVLADRLDDGWQVAGVSATPAMRDALDALVDELTSLRAVDAFRPGALAAYGLDPPSATIAVTSADGTARLALGSLNTVGSAVYARRDEHGRVLQVGVYLLDVVRRVLEAPDGAAGTVRAYWPEIG
jgi:Domain of unknown function (DUF4340)